MPTQSRGHGTLQEAQTRVKRSLVWLAVLGLLTLSAGCSKRAPELVGVRGTVFYRGEPVRGGTVVFAPDPDRGGSGPLAIAEIQPDGTYVLRTDGENGAVPGWHRVTVSPAED